MKLAELIITTNCAGTRAATQYLEGNHEHAIAELDELETTLTEELDKLRTAAKQEAPEEENQ